MFSVSLLIKKILLCTIYMLSLIFLIKFNKFKTITYCYSLILNNYFNKINVIFIEWIDLFMETTVIENLIIVIDIVLIEY